MFDLFGRKKAQAVLARMREDEEWHNSLVSILTTLDNNVQLLKEAQLKLVDAVEDQENRIRTLEGFIESVMVIISDLLVTVPPEHMPRA